MDELDSLYETKKSLEQKIENFFGGKSGHTGDRGYQELLEELENTEQQIHELESEPDSDS